jgi:predicted ATP-binding protein involved in virulence
LALNPQLGENAIKETGGVVLIDEIDLHLHPRWQQKILDDLQIIFPQVQFIVTTHAPSVIQSMQNANLMILSDDDVYYPKQGAYGLDVNSVLLGVMDARIRPEAIERKFEEIYGLIDNGELIHANKKTEELERLVGISDPEISGIRVTLDLEALEG